jgi:hypothetical protein
VRQPTRCERVRLATSFYARFAYASAIRGIGSGIWFLSALNTDVKHHGESLAKLEKAADDQRQANERFREFVLERLIHKVMTIAYEGTVVKAGKGELTIKQEDGGEKSFHLAKDATVTVKGKPGKLEDLKHGTRVRVMAGEMNVAVAVETID